MVLGGKFKITEGKVFIEVWGDIAKYPFGKKVQENMPFGTKTLDIVAQSLRENEADYRGERARLVVYDKRVLGDIEGGTSPMTYDRIQGLIELWMGDDQSRVSAQEERMLRDDGEFVRTGEDIDHRSVSVRFDYEDGSWDGLNIQFAEDWKSSGEVDRIQYVMPRD